MDLKFPVYPLCLLFKGAAAGDLYTSVVLLGYRAPM